MGGLVQKQGQFLLNNEKYAWLMTALLAVMPFAAWLSMAVVALVTLRKGWHAGIKCLIIGVTAYVCMTEVSGILPYTIKTTIVTYILTFACACILRSTFSWEIVAGFVVFLASIAIITIHWLLPETIIEQYKLLLAALKSFDQGKVVADMLAQLQPEKQAALAYYLLGINAVSLIASSMFSLMFARSIQSSIFYPDGFKKEMLEFRAYKLGVLLLVASAYGAYQNNVALLSCLPIYFAYLMAAGITLSMNLLANKRRLVVLLILITPILVMPNIMLPAYVVCGSLDSLFNLRSRLLTLAGNGQKKG